MKKNIRWEVRYRSYLDDETLRVATKSVIKNMVDLVEFLKTQPEQWYNIRMYYVTEMLDEKDCPVSVKYEEIF